MKKKFIIAISLIATITAGAITGCAAYEKTSKNGVISEVNTEVATEDNSSYITTTTEPTSSLVEEVTSEPTPTTTSEPTTTKAPKKDTSKDDSSVAETSKKVTETPKATETPKPTEKVTETPKTTQAPTVTPKVTQAPTTTTKVTQAPTVTPKVTEAPKVTTPTSKPSHTHNWKPVYYTKYANYQATTDGGSFVSKSYYFYNENGDLASEQDHINYDKACEECIDFLFSPQNKTASSYAEISKPFGPIDRVYFYYCVNGSNIEATLNPNGGEVFNFSTSALAGDVTKEFVWVKGTVFENM